MRAWLGVVVALALAGIAPAQQSSPSDTGQDSARQQSPEKAESASRDEEAGESSSKSTRIDLRPPKDDAKNHPFSGSAVADAKEDASPDIGDVQEFHPWDPYRAAKDVEVGDFYFKRKNYKAALDRYREALTYKDNDAVATFRLAQCLEKVGRPEEARVRYEGYLKILPHGPFAIEAQKSIDRLKATP
jgi:Flp pilus assembly protein TadD